MSDRFYKDIELPDLAVGVNPPTPDEGFIQLYGRNKTLVWKDSLGVEHVVGASMLDVDGGNYDIAEPDTGTALDGGIYSQ